MGTHKDQMFEDEARRAAEPHWLCLRCEEPVHWEDADLQLGLGLESVEDAKEALEEYPDEAVLCDYCQHMSDKDD